jgi:glycosyltransferase involved in cell wall biosynthesis
MRILAVETHYQTPTKNKEIRTSAVDWWRIISPFTHLQKNTDWEIDIQKGALDHETAKLEVQDTQVEIEWTNVGLNYDLVFLSYMASAFGYSYLHVLGDRFGLKHSLDFDDDLLHVADYNPTAMKLAENPVTYEYLKTILKISPYLTVTNPHLKKVYKDYRKKKKDEFIKILPNYIDLEVYKPQKHIDDDVITIAYQGGSSHYGDLTFTSFGMALSYILGKYKDKVKFELVGYLPGTDYEDIPGVSKVAGHWDFYKWVAIWKERSRYWDIAVAPLEDIGFNECKSNIKWQEYSAASVPVIASNVGPYKFIQDGETGFKVNSTKQWIEYLEALINNETLRRKIGQQANKELQDKWLIQNHWKEWKEVVEEIYG